MSPVVTRILPVGSHYEATFDGHYRSSSYAIEAHRMGRQFVIPREIFESIFEHAGHIVFIEVIGTRTPKHAVSTTLVSSGGGSASTPPADGSCPFIDRLPAEIRRKVLVDGLDSLPSPHQTIEPTCGAAVCPAWPRRKPFNPLTKLMLISKKIRDEIAEVVYEERTFGIHVHQGFQNAGIEFLHVGRQPLQYLENISDGRFTKFRPGDMFGFCRLKKIEIAIFPYDGAYHHTAINTYFMNVALVRLLHRSIEKEVDRITSIRITFPEGDSLKQILIAAGSSWWDTAKDRPRQSSIHGISDIELVLRPFAQLSNVHRVDIQLPNLVDRHVRSVKFVDLLQEYMTAKGLQKPFNSDELEKKIESARFALEDFISRKLYGGTGISTVVSKITDEELEEGKGSQDPDDDDDDDHDMEVDNGGYTSNNQHDRNKDRDDSARMHAIDRAIFDEDGGFLDDPDTFHDDETIAPNEISDKVADFVACFMVHGDVARRYLSLCENNLARASELFVEFPDADEAAVAMFKDPSASVSDGPVTPNNKHGGSSRSNAGDSSGWRKNNKGKAKAKGKDKGKNREVIVIDSDEDDEDEDEHNCSRFRSSNAVRGTRETATASNSSDVRGLTGAPSTIVRRDSSAGLAATYSQQQDEEIPTRVSEYRPYSSPPNAYRTGGPQTSSSHVRQFPPRRNLYHSFGRSRTFINPGSQQSESVSNNMLEGSLQYAQTTYRNSVLDGSSQDAFATATPSSASHPYSAIPGPPSSHQPTMTQSNNATYGSAPWAGGSYYTNDDFVSVPIAPAYPSSNASAPVTAQTLDRSLPVVDYSQFFSTSSSFMQPFASGVAAPARNSDDVFVSQSYHTSAGSYTVNNVAMAPLQRSNVSLSPEAMIVDDDEDSPPGGVPVHAEQMQDSGF